jgi:hypothetical protein
MASPTIYASFLIRLWREVSTDATAPIADWQGEVEHIQSGQCWVFDTWDKLLVFLGEQVNDPKVLGQLADRHVAASAETKKHGKS